MPFVESVITLDGALVTGACRSDRTKTYSCDPTRTYIIRGVTSQLSIEYSQLIALLFVRLEVPSYQVMEKAALNIAVLMSGETFNQQVMSDSESPENLVDQASTPRDVVRWSIGVYDGQATFALLGWNVQAMLN